MQYKDENGVNEPSRRRLLKVIGALALAGSCPVAHAQKTQSAPGTLSPDARNEKQPFYGEHQAGILTPQQAKSAPATTRFRHSWRLHCAR